MGSEVHVAQRDAERDAAHQLVLDQRPEELSCCTRRGLVNESERWRERERARWRVRDSVLVCETERERACEREKDSARARERGRSREKRESERKIKREKELACDEQLALWVTREEAVLVEEVVDHAREHLHVQG